MTINHGKIEAIGYTRTSSASNVGPDKDSEARQRAAIERCARQGGMTIVEWFADPAVSGADPVETRPGFAALLLRLASNGVRTLIVETASRFARDLMIQEVGFAMLQKLGVTLIAADSPTAFQDDTPTAVLIRQLLGAVAQFDKTMTVAKLKGARERKRAVTGKCEGRKSHAELHPEVVGEAKRLRRRKGMTLRKVAAELAAGGFLNQFGRPYAAASIRSMVD